jgi:hypothetical protein
MKETLKVPGRIYFLKAAYNALSMACDIVILHFNVIHMQICAGLLFLSVKPGEKMAEVADCCSINSVDLLDEIVKSLGG